MKRAGLLLLALALTACGAQTCIGCTALATPPSVFGSNGPFQAVATPSRLPAGGTVHLTLTVRGPLQYEAGCVQTLHIWAEDSQHQQAWNEPVPAIQCMAIAEKPLAAGETARFTADWPVPAQLEPGPYTIHGLFLTVLPMGAGARVRENLPPLTIEISS